MKSQNLFFLFLVSLLLPVVASAQISWDTTTPLESTNDPAIFAWLEGTIDYDPGTGILDLFVDNPSTAPSGYFSGDLQGVGFYAPVGLTVSASGHTLNGFNLLQGNGPSGLQSFDIWLDEDSNPNSGSGGVAPGNNISFAIQFDGVVGDFNINDFLGLGDNNIDLGFRVTSISGNPNGTSDKFGIHVVPEPSTYALIFGSIALGVVVIKRRLQNKAQSE